MQRFQYGLDSRLFEGPRIRIWGGFPPVPVVYIRLLVCGHIINHPVHTYESVSSNFNVALCQADYEGIVITGFLKELIKDSKVIVLRGIFQAVPPFLPTLKEIFDRVSLHVFPCVDADRDGQTPCDPPSGYGH